MSAAAERAAARVVGGECAWAAVAPDGDVRCGRTLAGIAVLSGAFNPLHVGHRRLGETAARILGREVLFELPLVNADKAPIETREAERRALQFAGFATLLLTRAPLFSLKAEIFPDSVFVVGADTLARVLEPRFYGGDAHAMAVALDRIRARRCRFLAAGRLGAGGAFLAAADLDVPARHADLVEPIPEGDFRIDVSSTAIRAGRQPS